MLRDLVRATRFSSWFARMAPVKSNWSRATGQERLREVKRRLREVKSDLKRSRATGQDRVMKRLRATGEDRLKPLTKTDLKH